MRGMSEIGKLWEKVLGSWYEVYWEVLVVGEVWGVG